jgi:Rrf2 family protein
MSQLLNFSESVLIAMHGLALMAKEPGRQISTKEIAGRIASSDNTVSKVLQRLVKENLISSTRGPSGGFILSQSPDKISLLRIYEAIEGKVDDERCLFRQTGCLFDECLFGGMMDRIRKEMNGYFSGKTLRDLAGKNLRGEI